MGKSKINKLLRSSLNLSKAIAKSGGAMMGYISLEICFWLMTLGIGYLFISWGISYNVANYAALGIAIAIVVLLVVLNSWRKAKKSPKSSVKLANWIAIYFADKTSPEWTEYQDWLHDILLARRQLLEAKYPKWKVFLITYWRLIGFLVIVSFTRIKNAVAIMKLR